MAIKFVRKQRKNADGTYDIIHPETQAKVVWMSDGKSVEDTVNDKQDKLTGVHGQFVGFDADGNVVSAEIPIPDVSGQISSHNTATDAHNDIRLLVEGLTNRLNTLANSTDEDLDQMAEIVAYIKSNKGLIEEITTKKVNVEDIIDNLTTNVSNKPLSAAQGVAIKSLIDAIKVPTKVSELTNDAGYLTSVPSEYVTETELTAKGYLTEHQSLAGLATETYVDDAIEAIPAPDLSSKQDNLVGVQGQIVGFDENGNAIAIENESAAIIRKW